MHAWARWALGFVVCALTASVTLPARAGFPLCTSEYLASFDARLATVEYDCVERERWSVSTASGPREVRIIHDLNADWIISSGEMANFDRGVRESIAAFGRLGGDVQLENVTILLADDFPPRESDGEFSNMAGLTETVNDGECRIIFYLVGPASRPEYAPWLVAHEFFHCVQAANQTVAQLESTGGAGTGRGGDWWLEGSATWFAALAVPEMGPLEQFLRDFDADSPTVALNDMAYGAVVFFLWYAAETSPAGVMSFLHGMAESADASAQHAAMLSLLPQERWLDFGEAYFDRNIPHPHGIELLFEYNTGDDWTWTATRTQNVELAPFTLVRGVARFRCGTWANSTSSNSVYSARPGAGGEWTELPASLEATADSGGGPFLVEAINASTSDVRLAITGRQERSCAGCAGVTTRDSCVVGTWQLVGGGPAEWMRRQGVPDNISVSNGIVQFRADGTFVTAISRADIDQRYDPDVRVQGQVRSQATGRWSTSGGRLNLCESTQAGDGAVGISTEHAATIIPNVSSPPSASREAYTCAGGSLNTEREMRGMSPMPFNYARIGD